MKKLAYMMVLLLALWGCSRENVGIDRAMNLRTSLLNGNGCAFDAKITADFGDKTYEFSLQCQADQKGDLRFRVQKPEGIEGITGSISEEGGKLTFDNRALAFPLLADGILSPISGPWVMIKAMRSGYVRLSAQEEQLLRITVDDSYAEDAVTIDLWIDAENRPVRADLYENNRRIMVLEIENFQLL